ncbi:sensor histidine kinase [Aquimarina sp. 2201CG14-23]|uniref:sensor histidine kinase n=1 Tax=Aquimarina mycalae TaxID=3040073 RepID=UPI002477FB4B|nr:histidine kinase [Aquimarina sp. 2201CG14-23]MDH7444635.1 histidine kinase [Aquimarina sp. 2201CG14-23]
MSTFKISKRSWFWILQLIGWGLPGGLNVYSKIAYVKSLSAEYVVAEGILFMVTGILFSTILWLLIRDKISFDSLSSATIIRTILIFLIVGLLMGVFTEVIAQFIYKMTEGKEMPPRLLINYVSTFINMSLLLFLWLVLYLSIKSIWKSQQNKVERLKLKTTLKESQLNTLKGQINPHFMFNSLNNIRGLMLEDVHKSRDMITKLSELLRYSLNSNKVDVISLQEEIEIVRNYIELSKIQFEKRLRYKEEIKEDVLDTKIPPMLIQMLIENAIKHGISEQIDGGEVSLVVFKLDGMLHIEVKNTGKLKDNISSTKIGLQNIQERLRLLYGTQSFFSLTEAIDEVTALIKIPLHE